MSSAEAKVTDVVLQMVGLATRARRRKVAKLSNKELNGIHEALDDVREYSQQLRKTIDERKERAAGKEVTKAEGPAETILMPTDERREEVMHAIDEVSKDLAQRVVRDREPDVIVRRLREVYAIEVKHALEDVTSDFTRQYRASAFEHLVGGLLGAMVLFDIVGKKRALWPDVLRNPSVASVSESMEALVMAELVARIWQATHIVGINAGGALVGQYLAARLGLSSQKLIRATCSKDGRFALRGKLPPSNARVLIINDIAADKSLQSAHQKLLQTHSKNSYQCMALVAVTTHDYKDLYGYAPRLTTHEKVELPWATDGEFHVRGTTYSLGTRRREIAITKSQAEQLAKEITRSGA